MYEHLNDIMTTVVALIILTAIVAVLRIYWTGPVDIIGFLESLLLRKTKRDLIHLEYRDSIGALMYLGPYVNALLRNGSGATYELLNGYFPVSDHQRFKPGTPCLVTVADLIKERLTVQVDLAGQTLFVKSHYTLTEMVNLINQATPREDGI